MKNKTITIPLWQVKARIKKRIYLANKEQFDKIFKGNLNTKVNLLKTDLKKEIR